MIPKTIHYCWFGGKKKPKLVRDCIASWEIFLPEYKIMEWNEKNTNLSHPFVTAVYKQKKWAFVSDYVRLAVLSEHGGIYLDTDMMLLKNLDTLLNNKCFFGAEDQDYISCGIIGSIPNFQFIEQCKSLYDELPYDQKLNTITIPRLITKKFREHFNFEDKFEVILNIENIKLFPFQYFYPFPLEKKMDLINYRNYIVKDSIAVHLWSSSWVDYSEFYYFRNSEYFKGLKKMIYNLRKQKKIDVKYIKKLASALKESCKN